MTTEDSRASADIALLFELSLGVSQSLELQTNCERFLGRLISRKNLSHAALWVRCGALPRERRPPQPVEDEDLALVYRVPRRLSLPTILDADHPALRRARSEGPFSVLGGPQAPSAALGVRAVFPLGGIGLLELGSLARGEPMPARELGQLATVIGGFAVSVKGCLDHLRMVSEMTARKQLDEQLRHAQKMEAVGQLAGGIAHDFNNLLVGILGAAELLQREDVPTAERRELAGIVLDASQRAADLTRQLLAFSRREAPARRRVDLGEVVAEVVRLLERTVDPKVRIDVEPLAGGAPVLGDASELQNALLNLGLNARDAMPQGGRLVFRVRRATPQEAHGPDPGALPHPEALAIEVEDSGVGMTEQVRSRVFEPFFTTKPFGHGTGLGLAAVYGTVKRHGGTIRVESEPGQGSRFTLLLPLATQAGLEASPAAPSDDVLVGRGRVLVVDDEEAVGEMCVLMLESLGYEAHLARSGAEGLEACDAEETAFDLVILDMLMPGMSGVTVLEELRARGSSVPVVMCSGFGHAVDERRVHELGIRGTLPKPFTRGRLSQVVAHALQGRAAHTNDAQR
jgi:signal transduction histidine kinase/ActR/RegA family two-component response regulator